MADYYRDLTRLLREAGYEFKRQGRGDHEIWWNRGRYSKGLLINVRGGHGSRPRGPGGNAIALIEIDGELPADVLAKVRALPQVQQAKPLKF
jgi:hypothetical protein